MTHQQTLGYHYPIADTLEWIRVPQWREDGQEYDFVCEACGFLMLLAGANAKPDHVCGSYCPRHGMRGGYYVPACLSAADALALIRAQPLGGKVGDVLKPVVTETI